MPPSYPDAPKWSGVGGDPIGAFGYGDKNTIRHIEDNLVAMWTLLDLITPWTRYGEPYKSSASLQRFDCSRKLESSLGLKVFAGNMGTGRVIYSESVPTRWKPVKSDTMMEALLEMACKQD
jgi:hypothetical protein